VAFAQFAEKEYEIAMAIELAGGAAAGARVYPCGQVLEEILGYDAASDPDRRHPIWAVIATPRPLGVRLVPEYWDPGTRPSAAQLPPGLVSLILQYKRPEFLKGPRAKQWRLWFHPYFRFGIRSDQQRVLKRIEQRIGSETVVRYACPAIWERGDFERARFAGTLARESGFVSPSALAGHRVWTFDRPGSYGQANPERRRGVFESLEGLFSAVAESTLTGSREVILSRSVPAHVLRLGEVCREREPRLRERVDRWLMALDAQDLGLTQDQMVLLGAYASTVTLLSWMGATWQLVRTV
jgi:hypothetical protein